MYCIVLCTIHNTIQYMEIVYMPSNINESIKQRIINAANELVASGIESPTNMEVREKLGGGSLSHISPIMRLWRSERKEQITTSVEIPDELKKAIETALTQVWTTSNNIAFSSIEAIKSESNILIDEANNERDEALIEVQRLEDINARLEKELEDKEFDIEAKANQFNEMKAENLSLQRLLDERRERLIKLEADYEKLQQELIAIVKNSNTLKNGGYPR